MSGAGTANLRELLTRRLRADAVVEVRPTAPELIGEVIRFTMRGKGRQPKKASLCLPPGATRPSRCT